MEKQNGEIKDYFGPVTLIVLGVVLLLNTSGVIPWAVWFFVLQFWPIILIHWGLEMIFAKSKIALNLVSLLFIFIFIFLIYRGNETLKNNQEQNYIFPINQIKEKVEQDFNN